MPIESTWPAFIVVARMPEAWPRSRGGTAFMIWVEFGATNSPEPTPLRNLLGLQPQHLRGDEFVHALDLRARPDLRDVAAQLHDAVERLHRRVGQIGKAELCLEGPCRMHPPCCRIAAPEGRQALPLHELPILDQDVGARARLGAAFVPTDIERVAAAHRGPAVLCQHRDAGGRLDHLDDTRHPPRRAGIVGGDGSAEALGPLDHRGQHAWAPDVERQDGPDGRLGWRIEARRARADQPPVPRILPGDLRRLEHVLGRSGLRRGAAEEGQV